MTQTHSNSEPDAKEPTISAYIQCDSNQRALYEALKSFRTFYPSEDITLVSDAGDDFTRFAEHFDLHYYRSEKKAVPFELGDDGAREYLWRVYEHCRRISSDYVLVLEADVTTRRRIRRFPTTDCAGPRPLPLTGPMNRYLQQVNDTTDDYFYVMCGGSIFDRRVYMDCYEKENLDLDVLKALDDRIVTYCDVLHTVVFLINGYSSGEWEEVSETKHRHKSFRIFRDAAFDHADKTWYGVEFDDSVFDQKPDWSARRDRA
jgi:hypothetical protein